MQLGALAHWLQGQPHERIIDFNGRYAAIRKMSYHAQLTNLSMRHDTTLPPTPKTNPQINIKSTPTDSTHTGQTQLHRTHTRLYNTYLHRHPNILSELLWHPVHMCDVAAVSLKIKLGYSDLTVCSAKLCINTLQVLMISAVSGIMLCYWNVFSEKNCSHKSKRIWLKTLDVCIKTDLITIISDHLSFKPHLKPFNRFVFKQN